MGQVLCAGVRGEGQSRFCKPASQVPVLQLLNTTTGSLLPAVLFHKRILLSLSQAIPITICKRA